MLLVPMGDDCIVQLCPRTRRLQSSDPGLQLQSGVNAHTRLHNEETFGF